MAQFEPIKDEIEKFSALVYIAAEKRTGMFHPEKFFADHQVSFPFLLDEDRAVTKAYDVYHRIGIGAFNIARPATFVIDVHAMARFAYVGIDQRDHGVRGNAGDGHFIGVPSPHLNFDGPVAAIPGQVDDRFSGAREEGLGGDADGVGKAVDDDIHAAVHARAEAGVGLGNGGVGAEVADAGVFVAGFGEEGDLANEGVEGEFGEGIDANLDFLISGNAAAIDLFDLGVHEESGEVGHFGEDHAGVDVVADFEGLGVDPALGVVGLEDKEAGDGRLEFHLGDAGLGKIDIGLGLIAHAGEGGDAGAVGGGVEIDGGLLDFEFLLGDAVIDLAGLALETGDDLLFGGFEAGALDGETGVGELGLVLFGGDFGLGEGLIEGGLGLAEGGLLLHEGLLGAGGIEFDDGIALLDAFAGRGHPGDAEVRDHGSVDLDGTLGFELTAAADEDEEITLAGGGGGENGSGLGLAVAVDTVGCAGDDGKEEEEAGPEAQAGAGAGTGNPGGGIAHGWWVSFAGTPTTTAAERSGMRWESDLSSLKTAVKLLMGLPRAEAATGLANSKWAGMARSG